MITIAQLRALYPRAQDSYINAFAEQAPDILPRYGISGMPNRLEYFLAQIGHESGGLTIVEEGLSYSAQRLMTVWPKRFPTLASTSDCAGNPEKLACLVYANRMGNGPPESGDGYRFRGRGYIQITGKDNYQSVGTATGIDLVGNPDGATAAADILEVACGFWKQRNINVACDAGDFTQVTKLINGGTIGLDARLAWLSKVRQTLAQVPTDQPSADVVIAIQNALRARGFNEIGAADGVIGPRTASAIQLFRQRNGLGEGIVDEKLLGLLDIADS